MFMEASVTLASDGAKQQGAGCPTASCGEGVGRTAGDAENTAANLRRQVDANRQVKSELLRAKLRGQVSQSDYSEANAQFDAVIRALEEQTHANLSAKMSLDGFVRFAKLAQCNTAATAATWELAPAEQRLVFKIFFLKTVCATFRNRKSLNTLSLAYSGC
jgi:hypothetical protein